jgi:hypothetical protein
VILSKQQAMDIYTMRSPDTTVDPDLKMVAGKSSMVAEMYGVSPKTVRVCPQAPHSDDDDARLLSLSLSLSLFLSLSFSLSLSLSLSPLCRPQWLLFRAAQRWGKENC